MGAGLRVFRRRIRTVQSTKKITRAMELIAASRIVKAQNRLNASLPYAQALVDAIQAAVSYTSGQVDHPLTAQARLQEWAAVLVITSDRGLAGAYSSNAIREAEALSNLLQQEGKQVKLFVTGRKGVNFYRFRGRELAGEWTGFSESPSYAEVRQVAQALLDDFLQPTEEGGADEIHVVYTHFVNMGTQQVRARRLLPLEIVDEEDGEGSDPLTSDAGVQAAEREGVMPLYAFEPSVETVLDALLPRYVTYAVYTLMLMSAASEHAARRRAMKSASDNADDLIMALSRAANQARQAEITQEISEIVGGVDALTGASAGSE